MLKKTRRHFSSGQKEIVRKLFEIGFSMTNLSRTLNVPFKPIQAWKKKGHWVQSGEAGGAKFAENLRLIIELLTREMLLTSAAVAFGVEAQAEFDQAVSQQINRLASALKNLNSIEKTGAMRDDLAFLKRLKAEADAFFKQRHHTLDADEQAAIGDFLNYVAKNEN